ncbi:uncharacterized protein N7511_003042 [Penicillium nucicola]|uniref:uncharacterized protein n=1 Tax=Penicillium nucicola TaxID=1850975 RepID=UPI0025452121|nr:uncharacterized protein N7511_003042 [Penicillium nucicola]KAJ5770991.1 hypothetical protein N7511_003042 [Penicillium nucicola]
MASIAKRIPRTSIGLRTPEVFTPLYFEPTTTLRFRLNPRLSPGASIFTPIRFFSTPGCKFSKEEPRSFPTNGFENLPVEIPVAEEQISDYDPRRYYPVHIGEIFEDRFQVRAKLGWGSCSTTWLARDMRDKKYVALKVYIHNSVFHRELPFYEHIASYISSSSHVGRENIRKFHESFTIAGPDGKHIVLVQEPALMGVFDFQKGLQDKRFGEEMVKMILVEVLQALDFLHTECEAIHADVHPGNFLACADEDQNDIFQVMDDHEMEAPSDRKQVSGNRTIYASRALIPQEGPLRLSDFGESRIGPGPYKYNALPMVYRAPEIMIGVPWSYPIDIWCVGIASAGDLCEATHLAEIISLLGPPPAKFLALNPRIAADFWDESVVSPGKWKGIVPIPENPVIESMEGQMGLPLSFVKFLRRALTWMPSERATARELLDDPWLKD